MTNTEEIFPPSRVIKERLASRGLNQTSLAVITGRNPSDISNYLTKEKISIEFAKELSLVLGDTPEYWLNLENKYRLLLSDELDKSVIKRNGFIQDFPLKEMQKRGWIQKTDNFEDLEPELEKFFDLEKSTLFKRTINDEGLNPAERAWLWRAYHLATILPSTPYNPDQIDSLLLQLRKVAKSSKAVHKVAELLRRYGIRFVVVEPLPRAKIDGAAFWLDAKSPVVALSIRFDNVGSFWFALIHEIIHIKNKDAFSLDNLEESPVNEIEARTNKETANFFVPQDKLNRFIQTHKPYFSKALVNNLATELNIHPGIIVGQLQHRKEVGFNTHREATVKVRELATMTAFTDGWGHPVPIVNIQK